MEAAMEEEQELFTRNGLKGTRPGIDIGYFGLDGLGFASVESRVCIGIHIVSVVILTDNIL
jgi:hypothetical protein